MKQQNFYPKQVLRALAGKYVQLVDEAQQHALKFFVRHSRQQGIAVGVIQASGLLADGGVHR
jgi:hypothetical protein